MEPFDWFVYISMYSLFASIVGEPEHRPFSFSLRFVFLHLLLFFAELQNLHTLAKLFVFLFSLYRNFDNVDKHFAFHEWDVTKPKLYSIRSKNAFRARYFACWCTEMFRKEIIFVGVED